MKRKYEIIEIEGIRYMLVQDAAARLKLSAERVRGLIRDGILKSEKKGLIRFITVESIEAYERTRRPVGRPAGTVKPAQDQREAKRRAQRRKSQTRRRKASAKIADGKKK